MPDFELFHRAQPTKTTTPMVTITPRGQMILNDAAFTAIGNGHVIGGPKAAELLYDEKAGIVGIRALAEPGGPTAFPFQVLRSGDGSRSLYAMPFLDRWNISVSTFDSSRSWPATVEAGVLCVDLSKPGTLTDQIAPRRPSIVAKPYA